MVKSLADLSETIRTTEIKSVSDLLPYLDAWRELAAGAPMRSPEWMLAWQEIYLSSADELCILLFHDLKDSLVGLAPLYLHEARGRNATFRLLGSGDVSTNHTTWFSVSGWEHRVGMEVGKFLLRCRSNWKRLLFESVDEDDVAIAATVNFLVEGGCIMSRRVNPNCWSIKLPATWDDYLRILSRSLRKRCRKLQRRFFDSGRVLVHQVENEADLRDGFDILLKLHAVRWGCAKKPDGVFGDQKFLRFHERISRIFLARGNLRLAWLECDGKPIAVEYQFVDSKAVYAYQAGIDLDEDEYSPGKLSMMAAIQFAIARGCSSFDLLRGDEPYKANWRAVPAACNDYRIWQRGIRSLAEWAIWELFALAVRLLKPKMNNGHIKFLRKLIPR
jgi:hypothetical protein